MFRTFEVQLVPFVSLLLLCWLTVVFGVPKGATLEGPGDDSSIQCGHPNRA